MAEPEDEAHLSWKHFVAGALAGTAEHTGMYPIDVLKTHQQSVSEARPMLATARALVSRGGISSLFRGVTAIALGAAPAHALYFSCYEAILRVGVIGEGDYRERASWLRLAVAGAVSTLLQDAVMVPMDAVKQRRQLAAAAYVHESTYATVQRIVRSEGVRALYAGYTTTLVMNVPFHSLYFNCYELLRRRLEHATTHADAASTHMIAGAVAGVVAAAVTNPLDVVRTRLQTQNEVGRAGAYRGLIHATQRVWCEEGMRGFGRGVVPRMLFHSCSAAVLWTSYEYLKALLGARNVA